MWSCDRVYFVSHPMLCLINTTKNSNNSTSLMLAVHADHIEIIRYLIHLNADVNQTIVIVKR